MASHNANIALCSEALKQARLPSEKARYQSQIKSSRRLLAKLEEVAVRHEQLARSYGYKGPLKQK